MADVSDSSIQTAEATVYCKLCLSDCPASETSTLRSCDCVFCTQCLRQYVQLAIRDGAGSPITCPDVACKRPGALLDSEIASFASGDEVKFYQRLKFERGISKIPYVPDAGVRDVLCFKYYNAKEVVRGRTMEDWLRFSVCYWHSFCGTGADPFGSPTLKRPWNEDDNDMERAKRRLSAAFEFFTKLGVKYYTFHDRDMAPEGRTLEESNRNLDEITDLALELQKQTGVKVLWVTCNLFAHPRYMNGAASNPDCHVFAFAGAQLKKGLEIAKKLQAENFVFWGGREGFVSALNTDVKAELKHMASFFRMAVAYKEKIGLKCQFLIEPKPKEPCKHQYDYDAMSVIGFLKHFGLDKDFKLNIEPNHTSLAGHSYEHDIIMASVFGMLGSVDANTGSPDLGWDTDQFPMDIRNTTLVMKAVIEQGGLQPGGLNFDAKVRRESTELEDLFIAHIGAMDAFARGLRNADKMIEEGVMQNMLQERYMSFSHGIGLKVEESSCSLEDLEEFIKQNGEPKVISGKQERYEVVFNRYL
ncbi:E3 ubiquitin-protein ligase RNF144B isoform X2 [Tachysurus vachellii]|uniref:E3 ubiquitin-protein ligase RNF144B isoform X2 n=1 Tax=Tachysurus vachellii TaxID=175792 RepID=UPI00296A9119|nr:E3 ubiquitin-protein ligase RNF144B isoform X2 [Tachysurus vachellii]